MYARFRPIRSPILLLDEDERGGDERLERDRRLDAARRSCRGRSTTAEIETFISDVSTTRTNIAAASRTARRELKPPSAASCLGDRRVRRHAPPAARGRPRDRAGWPQASSASGRSSLVRARRSTTVGRTARYAARAMTTDEPRDADGPPPGHPYAAEIEAERSGWYVVRGPRPAPDRPTSASSPATTRDPCGPSATWSPTSGRGSRRPSVQLVKMARGTYEGHDIDIDALNAALLEAMDGQPWEVAWVQANAARTRMLAEWYALADADRGSGLVDPQGRRRPHAASICHGSQRGWPSSSPGADDLDRIDRSRIATIRMAGRFLPCGTPRSARMRSPCRPRSFTGAPVAALPSRASADPRAA